MCQNNLFDWNELRPQPLQTADDYDYYADDAEAVVYLTAMDGFINDVYVMKRSDAMKFCNRKETTKSCGPMAWTFMFTTYRRNWYENRLKTFREDDGRFDQLFAELGIEPIYRIKKQGA